VQATGATRTPSRKRQNWPWHIPAAFATFPAKPLLPTEGIMLTRCLLSLVLILSAASSAFAQGAWQFRWQKGQTLTYKVKHVTSVVEVVGNTKSATQSSLDLVNRWQVDEVDANGVATMTLTLVAMRNEQKRANGETLLFDSKDLDKSTPELREQMNKYIGQTVAVLLVDSVGRVQKVKQGSASALEAEPPFVVVLPEGKPAVGQAWQRTYNIVLDPPFGTGEKYQAQQSYECRKIEAGKASLTLATEFKALPDNARERLPLLQKDLKGDIVFDVQAGRLIWARLTTDKTVENHQGKGSSYHFKSEIVRELAE
jgi:hypothetical protein